LLEAVEAFVVSNPGATNIDVARALGIEMEFEGGQKNYLSWTLLGILVRDGRLSFKMPSKRKLYFPPTPKS
jgi:hypothetical protein